MNDSELGVEVPVASIDKELRKLWEQDAARTNASLMNLVVYSERPQSLVENSGIIRELTREHACRALLVAMDRVTPVPSVRAWITAHCHLADGRKSVCCEQISFILTGRVAGRLRNTVFAHLSSDLPLVFWWQGELSDVFNEGLYSVVDRLMFDSSGWADPVASFRRIQEACDQEGNGLVVHDLEWTRSNQFRLGVAAMFDDPTALKQLPYLRTVDITYHPSHRCAALQVLAWVAMRADWQNGRDWELPANPEPGAPEAFSFESCNGLPIRASLRADAGSAPLGEVAFGLPSMRIRIKRDDGSPHIERVLECGGRTLRSFVPADPDAVEELVGRQLGRGGGNSLFRKTMPRFRELLGAGCETGPVGL
jgi:glucose-6-phosphate dehydrogenase assembly protein OpcA